jgi:DNA-binding LacI/PurR family transcriptional regulator
VLVVNFEQQVESAEPVHVQIERFLQKRLHSGELTPGQRLPSNADLARRWGVSCTDVQRAMARLTAAGLLERAPRRGTFVKASSAQTLVGILVKPSLANETAHFYRALVLALQSLLDRREWRSRLYDDLTENPPPGAAGLSRGFEHLRRDLLSYPVKGLIELNSDIAYPRSLRAPVDIARVRYGIQARKPDVALDKYRFGWEAVEFLARQGRKRILYLRTAEAVSDNTYDIDGFYDAVRKCGLPQPRVEQIDGPTGGSLLELNAYDRMRTLIRESASRRGRIATADAMLISDDIATRGAALALVQQGVRVPEDLLVVSYANEGVNLHYGIAVVRYEFSMRAIAKHLVEILWKRMQSEASSPQPILVVGKLQSDK